MELTLKEKLLKAVESMPSDAGVDEAMERLYVIHKIEEGIRQVNNGQTISHEVAKARLQNKFL